MTYTIEYHSDDAVVATAQHPGPVHKAESEALIGLIRYLMTGVKFARITDAAGDEVKILTTPAIVGQ